MGKAQNFLTAPRIVMVDGLPVWTLKSIGKDDCAYHEQIGAAFPRDSISHSQLTLR